MIQVGFNVVFITAGGLPGFWLKIGSRDRIFDSLFTRKTFIAFQ